MHLNCHHVNDCLLSAEVWIVWCLFLVCFASMHDLIVWRWIMINWNGHFEWCHCIYTIVFLVSQLTIYLTVWLRHRIWWHRLSWIQSNLLRWQRKSKNADNLVSLFMKMHDVAAHNGWNIYPGCGCGIG